MTQAMTQGTSHLLIHPSGDTGKVHDVTPASAGWGYVGFGLYRLQPGQSAAEATGDRALCVATMAIASPGTA